MKKNKISRKIISVIVSIILIVCSMVPCFTVANAAVWNGGMATPTLSGGVYQIASAENLAWFANAVNTGSNTIKGKLTADIQLNATGSHTNKWTPIGTSTKPFKGTFDGDGHTVSGVYIDTTADYQGLFGNVQLPEVPYEGDYIDSDLIVATTTVGIQNVNVTDSSISGNQNIGGIVGYGLELGVKHCTYSGSVNGAANSVGGIIGYAASDTAINECVSEGTVHGNQRIGGIAGYQSGNSVVTKSYSKSVVSGTQNVGGITGTLSSSFLEGCFFLGSVSATNRVGGVVGYSAFGTVLGVYSSAHVSASGSDAGGAVGVIYDGTYGSVFYDFSVAGVDGPVGSGRTTDEIKSSSFIKELNAAKIFYCFDYTNANDGFPVVVWMLASDVWLGELSRPSIVNNVYQISKPSELAWFAGLVNGTINGMEANPAANAKVTDDLLLNINVNDDSFSIIEWTPIGTSEHPYTGTFDGAGYNIAGLYTAPNAGQNGVNVGLFGEVGTGLIKNTVVIDGKIQGIENVGGIAGRLFGGTIQNCCCDSDIYGDRAVGGIVGNIGNNASTSVTLCSMIGSITGTNVNGDESYVQNVGGIVGYNNRASVSKCFTSGKISAPLARNVGGVIGYNSSGTLNSSYNTSSIVYGKTLVGGIVGYNNNGTVSGVYTAGKVQGTGSTKIGVAFGEVVGSVTACTYDSSFFTAGNTTDSATAKTSVQMTGTSAISNMGLSASDFRTTVNDTYFYYYPQISGITNSTYKVVKDGSVESVKRVQDKYIARVQVDGRQDTYYETVSAAMNYAANVPSMIIPTVYIVRDVEVSSTINATGKIRMYAEDSMTLTRAADFKGTMLNVTGSLTIGSNVYGNDDIADFVIDGNNVAETASAITVAKTGTLNIEKGVKVCNFNTDGKLATPVRGAVINNNGGNVSISGGTFGDLFKPNICASTGGVIYNLEGNVEITDGKFEYNQANMGAVIYNHNGTATISGGTFTMNEAKSNGGVSVSYGPYAETRITGKALLNKNAATNGGAVDAQNYSTTEIAGGTISENSASASGGACMSETGSDLIISGGYITENTAKSFGKGVYNSASLILKKDALIDSNNDVYLVAGKTLTIDERLTCAGYAATITPAVYSDTAIVLDGDAMQTNYKKIGVSNSAWHTLSTGKITTKADVIVASVSKTGSTSVDFNSLKDAFAAIKSGEEGIITLKADVTLDSLITVNGDVTLQCGDATTYTITRSGSYQGVMFDIPRNSVLRLGESINDSEQQSQSDYKNGADTNEEGLIIIDGDKTGTGVVGGAAVNVQASGNFYMHEGAVIQNCKNTTSGTVTVSGNMYMYGGTIRNNDCAYGGAVYVKLGATLNTYGGVIADNTSTNGGSAVYSLAKVTRNLQTYNYYLVETIYDESGNAIGQKAPVLKSSTQTDILVKTGDTVYVNTNLLYVDETSSDMFYTSEAQIPASSTAQRNVMTVALKTYIVNKVVLTGTGVATASPYFNVDIDGYYFTNTGALGINKLVATATSGITIHRPANLVSGINLSKTKVSDVLSLFSNNRAYMKVYSPSGAVLKSTDTVTTGAKIRLTDTSNKVLDEVEIVIFGDVNCDGKIDGMDSVFIRMIADGGVSGLSMSAGQVKAADINGDGNVTVIDAESTDLAGLYIQTIGQS